MASEESDIESQYNSGGVRVVKSKSVASPSICGVGALGFVGRIANVIRLVIAVALFIGAILIFLIASGVFVDFLVSIKVLYFVGAAIIIGAICVFMDSAASQWLVQKVLVKLSEDMVLLEKQVDRMSEELDRGQEQIDEREKQLEQSASQIQKQETIISDMALVQHNMGALVTSLMNAQHDGVDLNKLLKTNVDRLEVLLNNMTSFAEKNNLILRRAPTASDWFTIYTKEISSSVNLQ